MTKAIELSQLGNVLTVAEGTGNVGIRESSPSYEFHVKGAGTVAYFEGTGGNSFIGLEDSDDSTIGFIGVDGGSLKFQTSGNSYSDKLVITAAGQVGIGGIASTGALLHLRDSNNATKGAAQLKINKGVGTAAPTSISRADCYIHLGGSEWGNGGTGIYLMGLGYTNGETGTGIPAYVGFKETSSSGYTKGDLIFGTRANTTGTSNAEERLRITSDGKLIAKSPHSNGAINEAVRLTTLGTYSSSNSLNSGPAISFGQFHADYPTWTTAQIAGIRKGNNWHGALAFYTNSGSSETDLSQKLLITAEGNFALGRTGQITMSTGNKSDSVFEQLTNAYYPLALHSNETNKRGLAIFYAETGTGGNNNPYLFFENQTNVKFQVFSNGLVSANAGHFISNVTPTSGRGVEIFEAETGVGQIASFDRSGGSWDELRIKSNHLEIFTGSSNKLSSRFNTNGSLSLFVNDATKQTHLFTTGGANAGSVYVYNASQDLTIALKTDADSYLTGGRLGIGTAAPADYDGEANDLVVRSANHTGITVASTGTNQRCNLYFSDGTSSSEKYRGAITYDHNDDNMYIRTAGTIRVRVDSDGNVATGGSALFHGSSVLSDFTNTGRSGYKLVSIRAGNSSGGATPANSSSAIKIYPAGTRSATAGNLTGGIAWQHLDPNYSTWSTTYGAGAQIWMGAALHDTPGQERDRFNLWMNSQTAAGSQPNNLAIEVYPNGVVRHPKLPCFMVRNSTTANAFFANVKATWNTIDLNNGSHFDNANDRFICPIDGFYHFSCQMLSMNNARLFHELRKNGTRVDGTRTESYDPSTNSYQTNTFVAVVQASANDYFEVWLGSQNGYGSIYANFNGHLIG